MLCSSVVVCASSISLSDRGITMVRAPPDSVIRLLGSCSISQDKPETTEATEMCCGIISMLARY